MVSLITAQGRSLFQWRDPQRTGRLTLTLDQLLELVLHLFLLPVMVDRRPQQ